MGLKWPGGMEIARNRKESQSQREEREKKEAQERDVKKQEGGRND